MTSGRAYSDRHYRIKEKKPKNILKVLSKEFIWVFRALRFLIGPRISVCEYY